MEIALSVAMGLCLAAAVGFRVFVPLLVLSGASMAGYVPLAAGMEWIGTLPALIVFASATVAEILAYYIPWVDNALDMIASPAAVVAGTIVAASVITDVGPMLHWILAIVAGGGAAGIVKAGSVGLRLKSSAVTGGIGNPFLATGELAGSVITSVMGILLPVVTLILLLASAWLLVHLVRKAWSAATIVR